VGLKKLLVISSFLDFCLILVFILPAYKSDHPSYDSWIVSNAFIKTLLIVTAISNGFSTAVIWLCVGNYISEAATPRSKGFYFGLFWIFYSLSYTVGSLIGALILKKGLSQTLLYSILSVIGFFAVISFTFTRKTLKHD
jgi:MFS family permease